MPPKQQIPVEVNAVGNADGLINAAGLEKWSRYLTTGVFDDGTPAPTVFTKKLSTKPQPAPTAWAFVIFQHEVPLAKPTAKLKSITLKYVLVSIGGVQRLLVFQNTPPVGVAAGKLQWYWRRSFDGLAVYPPLTDKLNKDGSVKDSSQLAKETPLSTVVQSSPYGNQDLDLKGAASAQVDQIGVQMAAAIGKTTLNGIDLKDRKIQVDDFDLSDPRFSTVYSPLKVDTVGTAATTATAKTEDELVNGVPDAAKNEMKLILDQVGMYGYVASWLIANYAANDTAVQGDTPVVGAAALQALQLADSDPTKPATLEFQPCQATIAKGPSGVTITHTFDPVTLAKQNDLKFDVNNTAILDALTDFLTGTTYQGQTVQLKYITGTVPEAPAPPPGGGAGKAAAPAAADDPEKPLEKWYAYTMHLSDPVFASDSTGTKAGLTINLTAPDSVHKNDFNPEPDLKLSGYSYVESDLFDGVAQLTWKVPIDTEVDKDGNPILPSIKDNDITFASPVTAGVKFEKSQLPNGTSTTKATTSGEFTSSVNAADALNTFNLQLSEAAGAEDTSNTQTGKAAVDTTDYHSTTYSQQLWHAYADEDHPFNLLSDTPLKMTNDGETYEHLVSIVTDLNEWIDPAVSDQKSNHYLASAGLAHIGADIPVPYTSFIDDGAKSPEFIRLDASMTGGGVAGESPDTARFYGGNSAPSGGATALPTPVIRSFGTGKLGLYPASKLAQGSQAGAVSFASFNCTLAIPVGLSLRFLDPDIARTLNYLNTPPSNAEAAAKVKAIPATGNNPDNTAYQLVNDDATHDMVSFVANYDDYFSMRPVATFDAAWLGGPANFSDRTLYSAGAGVEMSVTALNLDVLYEKTLHDTDSSHQALGKNIIVQLSYDIHF